ncbi:MAG: hypothetical protein OXH85_00800 [Truepera sp.]|nr:hypothetical protein [Truepera sp.]
MPVQCGLSTARVVPPWRFTWPRGCRPHRAARGASSALAGLGITPLGNIADEAFGRSLLLGDPAGLTIQINEHDPELYP